MKTHYQQQVIQHEHSTPSGQNITRYATLHIKPTVTLVACQLPIDFTAAVCHKLMQQNILCDTIHVCDFTCQKQLELIRKSVQKSGFLLMIDCDMIGKNVFPLLEKLIEEQAILYYLRRPHSIILLKNEPAEQDFHIDNICFQIMQQTHQLHE